MTPSLPHPAHRPCLVLRTLALLLTCMFAASAAFAQLPKIFVSSMGSDDATGARNTPKRNFQAAHDAVADGGEIVVLDTAGYGALSITCFLPFPSVRSCSCRSSASC